LTASYGYRFDKSGDAVECIPECTRLNPVLKELFAHQAYAKPPSSDAGKGGGITGG
jgi:hypothetical protein